MSPPALGAPQQSRASPLPEAIEFDGSVLPPTHRRFCGAEFRDHAYYLQSADAEARRLVADCKLQAGQTVLDVGCGQGRLAIGLSRVLPNAKYVGIDVDAASIEWCAKHLQRPGYTFTHVDVHNERYNRAGKAKAGGFRFPMADASVRVIYLYSVFSHMERDEALAYLREFRRLLPEPTGKGGRAGGALRGGPKQWLTGGGTSSGFVFLTTFLADDSLRLPEGYEINPPGYVPIRGPLHVVHYSRAHFESMAVAAGFVVHKIVRGVEANGQSAIYLRPA